MAKAAKPKKVKVENPPTITEPIEEVIEETVEEIIPEVVIEEKEEEPVIEIPEPIKEVVIEKVVDLSVELSLEQRIINFIDSRDAGEIKMNDFLKSLFGVPKIGELPTWLNQGASRKIRQLLDDMVKNSQIIIQGNSHLRLGTFYYPDSSTGKTAYRNLSDVNIVVKK